MIEPLLRSQLEPVARRRRLWRLSRDLALWWAAAAAVGLAFLLLYRVTGWHPGWLVPALAVGAFAGALVLWSRSRRWIPDFRQIARTVEEKHPELHAMLLTAVEQEPDAATGKFNYLQERLLHEAMAESARGDWQNTVSRGQVTAMQFAQVGALVLLLLALGGFRVESTGPKGFLGGISRVTVTPGDTVLERGSGLAVLARFDGTLPPEVTLVLRPDSQPERRVPLAKSLNDPVFGGTLLEVTNTLTYQVVYAGGRSREFKVDVFEFPRLERADAHVVFPSYTGLPEKKVENTRRVSAVEGSTLNLSLQLNKPVNKAQLIAKDKSVLPLTAPTDRANASLAQFALRKSEIYELVLVDSAGRTNKVPTQIVVEVLTNRPPELKFVSPRGDQRVSPLQEISFQAEAWDDFGLKGYGITYSLAGAPAKSISLGKPDATREKRQFHHLLSLEELAAEPDQLLSYFLWADDIGPDGQVRRSASDMYHAEIRPFDEIFREGQSRSEDSEQQEGQGGRELTQLTELQKQIINATWKLQRENHVGMPPAESPETGESRPQKVSPPASYAKDVQVIEQSQREAMKQASAQKQESQAPRSQSLWESVEQEMTKAADQLRKATRSLDPLPSALAAEQAAYQALLKLSAREKQVAQSQRSRGSGGGQQNQRQLDQLDLKQSENRYENQKQAAARQNPEQREQSQILNRLKELAQRQEDMNERLKELQTALQEAKTDQEREEVRRRLKRLREEEQQMLADVDELLQRMERPENQSRMADARQQLEQTRNQIQRTAEMIEKEAVSQALTAGTRAQRDLQELREDFRKKNSAQFSEDMREMRSEARDLADKEEQIGEKLKSMTESKRKSLSDTGETKQLLEQLGQQGQKLTNLLEQMTRVSQEAEVSEPLLSKHLYDTLRKASQGQAGESLQRAGELLNLSFLEHAGQFEERARTEIQEMKQGVERAAESVLGDEREALRLARNELDDLARQLEREIARATGSSDPSSEASQSANDQQRGQAQRAQSDQQQAGQQTRQAGQTADQSESQQPGGQPSDQSSQSEQLAQSQQGQQGQQGQQNSSDQAQQQAQSQNGAQAGEQPGGQQLSESQSNSPSTAPGQGGPGRVDQAQAPSEPRPNRPRQRASLSGQQPSQQSGSERGHAWARGDEAGEGGGDGGDADGLRDPLTGEGFADWSDRLRDVEEMLDLPRLREEVAGARERARAMRTDFKRHSKPPQWDLVRSRIAEPLMDVRSRISEELMRRESKDSLVPIDRDPVPHKFSELVQRYYENLGNTQNEPAAP